jgi:large subunit ribosomal protein L31
MADWYIGQTMVPVHARAHRLGGVARCRRRPGDQIIERDRETMKSGIHPEYTTTEVVCSCCSTFTTRSTAKGGEIRVETCSACHPFYTGKQRVLDTAGRVAKFQAKYAKVNAAKKK